MKKHVRILCLLLALCMVMPMLAACGGKDDDDNKKRPSGSVASATYEEKVGHLGGYDGEITISLSEYTSKEITKDSHEFVQGPDRITTDSVLNDIYERNVGVADIIGVEPRYTLTSLAYNAIAADIEKKVQTGKAPDLYIDQAYGMIRAQQAGYLKNAIAEGTNLDLSTEGWYLDYMHSFNFNSDEKLYLLAGDYTMDVIRFLNTVGCNLTMFENLFYSQQGTDLLYSTVENGNWTYDTMMEWCEVAFKDTGHTTGRSDEDDQLGLITYNGGPCVAGWRPSTGVLLFNASDSGKWSVHAKTDERAVRVLDKIIQLMTSTSGSLCATSGINDPAVIRSIFINGTALFTSGVLLSSLETEEYQNMEDDKCVIPYPKLDVTDDYCVVTHDNARVGAILISTENFAETTAWLQAMALTSSPILDSYYNGALKFKYGTDIGTTKMLDIIYSNISSARYITESAVTSLLSIATDKQPLNFWYNVNPFPTTNKYTSNYGANRRAYETALTDFVKIFNNLKN